MSAGRWLQLVLVNLGRELRSNLLSVFGVAAGIGSLVFFVALGLGVGEVVKTRLFPADARFVEVIPPRVSVGIFGGAKLDDAAVERLRALPDVEAGYRKMTLRIPAISRYDGSFFGQRLRMGLEILAEGVDGGLIEADLTPGVRFDDPEGDEPIPALVSTRLLEIYNKSFARMRGLPSLSPPMLRGFEFPVELGRSYVTAQAAAGTPLRAQARLAGISERAMLQGITIPLETARRLNARYGEDARGYSALVLVARTPDRVPAVAQAVRDLGFEIDDSERVLAERVGAAVAITTAALALLSLLICGLSAVNISLSAGAAVRTRTREIGVLRAVGATAGDVRRLFLGEAAFIGLAGGVAGGGLAWAVAIGVDRAARSWLPDFPFKPDSFFAFPGWLLAGAVAAGVAAALLGAFVPAHRASKLDPARAIGG
ncbi:ABC transporter permease [Vulgatibacter incomptus]|uniref:ABC transporter permease protein n=1 Tax=Vulgatibacter incomptus TaxID=1391653 RepID=A0A0K1PA30_9BACT|nr:ABC transporter permease [Vulgatibacter incomptus]AKU89974.1 ABC transporter permease protein [Vulgatibacter incomptus]